MGVSRPVTKIGSSFHSSCRIEESRLSSEGRDPAVKSGLIHGPSDFREPGTHSLFDIWPRERKTLPRVSQEVGSKLEQEARMEPNHGSER